jgi:hypothetical protein
MAVAAKKATAKKEVSQTITIPPISISTMKLTLVGDSPLITHQWSAKAKKMMLDKQMKKATGAKEAKNPEQDYKDSLYIHPDGGYGFPTIAFKAAAVDAATFVDGITKVEMRGAFHVIGEMAKIDGKPTPREDIVRVGMAVADIRYRAEFKSWKTTLTITYNSRAISAEQITNMFQNAGFAIGVGEWRPQKNGRNGMFHVA